MRQTAVNILNILARRIVEKYKPVVIGVTGSAGKSTTCKLLASVLEARFAVRFNDNRRPADVGLPLAIIGAEAEGRRLWDWIKVLVKACSLLLAKNSFYPDILVLEMGVDRPHDMKKMLRIVQPDIAVFASLGEFPAHAKYFKSNKHIAREKALLVRALGPSGLAVLNGDDEFLRGLLSGVRAQTVTFGFGKEANVRGEEIFLGEKKWRMRSGKIGMSFKMTSEGTTVPFRFSYALGRGQIYAALAAAAVGLHLGMNLVEISEALAEYRPLPGRMNLIKGRKGSLLIDDTYNANPGSMLAALETVGKLEARRKIAVLGDMLELGNYAKEGHRRVGESIPRAVDLVFCYGKTAKFICEFAKERGMKASSIRHFEKKKQMIEELQGLVGEGDVVLVKGSRRMRMEEVVKALMLEPSRADELLVK